MAAELFLISIKFRNFRNAGKEKLLRKVVRQLPTFRSRSKGKFLSQDQRNARFQFLYDDTRQLYGRTGNPSIDPVVFFKLMLTGYLEHITSDRRLVEHCSMRLDILYFLGYDIDESLPWHSTVSRTRQLYPTQIFDTLFNKVFTMCVQKGMVAGHTQAIDSAPVKANASMESLELKKPFNLLRNTLNV